MNNDPSNRTLIERAKKKNKTDSVQLPELGYTPANLRALRKFYELTQKEVAQLTDSSVRSIQNWQADPETSSHRAMPIQKWRELLSLLGISKPEYSPFCLRRLRLIYNLTQEDVAQLMETPLRTIQCWEIEADLSSHRPMPLSKWYDLLNLLGH